MSNETRRAEAIASRKARSAAARLSLVYAASAAAWIVSSDWALARLGLSTGLMEVVNTGKGLLFVVVTTAVLYFTSDRFLRTSFRNQEAYREAQESLRDRETSIRQAYIDVLDAVTGGRLILMWPDDIPSVLGELVMPETPVSRPEDLCEARRRLAEVLGPQTDRVNEEVLAISEALTNALKHAGEGEYSVRKTGNAMQVVITDHGPGIDFHTLPRAMLIPGFSTKPSLGMGFTIMLEVADRLLMATEPGLTTLVLEFEFASPSRNKRKDRT